MQTFKQIIQKWPSYQSLADDIGQPVDTVRKWHQRNRIPATVWLSLTSAASRRRYGVTLQHLCEALNPPQSEQ